jgi:antitoxin Phd
LSSARKIREWRLADAKNRFSELVNRALIEGPQRVLRRDDAVVVVSERDYKKLIGTHPDFKKFLLEDSPSLEGLDLSRERSPMRENQTMRVLLDTCVLSE